ncbi:hypothetical protein PENFLA_c032G07926 [Penicillium flavigenum]|uniref:Uncharacterized protein n=1 Tax=Penicillium flavigenum TaxID=254877 RepID=A0A1V6SMU3_9EURO|nr:hypothetical protein PENFLA_c032G07926 [Penicillium flavigenum]
MAVEPDERVLKVEVQTALAIMLMRLQGKEFPNHNTVPVMIVSIMARMQARILHSHYSHAGLVISKTGFLSFSTAGSALNMDIVLGMMASKVISDTKNPSNLLNLFTYQPGVVGR